MENMILYFGLFISILIFAFVLSQFLIDEKIIDVEKIKNIEGNLDQNNNNNNNNNSNNNDLSEKGTNNNQQGTSNAGGGSSSGGGSGSGGGSSSDSESSQQDSQKSCLLIRPGNLPNIDCTVNYIKSTELSLKISNSLGEDISIILSLDTCTPILQDLILNNQDKDFIFQCSNDIYFSESILVSYIFDQTSIEIGGFVIGPVS